MNYLQRYIEEVRVVLYVTLLLNNIVLLGIWYMLTQIWHLPTLLMAGSLLLGVLICNFMLERLIVAVIVQPIELLWRTILHVSPSAYGGTGGPKFAANWLGKDLVESMSRQIYQLVMVGNALDQQSVAAKDLHQNFIADSLPLPLLIIDKNENIIFANKAAQRYFGTEEAELLNHGLRVKVHMLFRQGDVDFDSWLAAAKTDSVAATQTWDSVRLLRAEGQEPLQFDLAAFYNKDNPENLETMLVYFDHTAKYSQTDQEVSFVALAIHELRTPITVLRGFIEVLDEELNGKLSGETQDYFNKLKASSQQLAGFINNILNVARIEGNQLELQLREENWSDVIKTVVESLRLRAEVRGLQLEYAVDADVPTVGVDRFSISEVIANLIDNAIKYSGSNGSKITIHAGMNDGVVETTVKDSGVGIAESVVPTLFNKFQRNFHNRASVSGTGLGLYLSKVIVTLHGGNIWVSSKEGKGTEVGFTVLPFASLTAEQKAGQTTEITRSAHGWIKNHTMSRR